MTYGKLGTALLVCLTAACSGGEEPVAESRAGAAADTAAAVDHSMHGTPAPAPDSADPHVGHGVTAATDHAGAGHAAAGTAAGAAPRHAEMDHGGSGASRTPPAGGMDHARMGHTAAPARGGSAGQAGHAGHAQTASRAAGGSSAQHATPSSGHAHPAGAPAAPEAIGHHGAVALGAPAAMPQGPGMDKLLTLVERLAQDSVVQGRIQADPTLRQGWADPGVRQILVRRP